MNNFVSRTTTPTERPDKVGWYATHRKNLQLLNNSKNCSLILIGDSIINGLLRYGNVWNKFKSYRAINCGMGGDKTQHVLWRAKQMHLPPTVKHIVIQAGTNNIDRDSPLDVAQGIMSVAAAFKEKSTKPKIIVTGLIPRDLNLSPRRRKITDTNKIIENLCKKESQVMVLEWPAIAASVVAEPHEKCAPAVA